VIPGIAEAVAHFLRIDPDMPRKRCTRCHRNKPVTAFYQRPKSKSRRFPQMRTTRDGLHSACKACHVDGVMRSKRKRRVA
jgi:hypothetical protein